jgi:hypothetical protein
MASGEGAETKKEEEEQEQEQEQEEAKKEIWICSAACSKENEMANTMNCSGRLMKRKPAAAAARTSQ